MPRVVIPETPLTKALVVVGCSYEVVALGTGELPSWTALTSRRPLIGLAILGTLAIHFFWPPTPTTPH